MWYIVLGMYLIFRYNMLPASFAVIMRHFSWFEQNYSRPYIFRLKNTNRKSYEESNGTNHASLQSRYLPVSANIEYDHFKYQLIFFPVVLILRIHCVKFPQHHLQLFSFKHLYIGIYKWVYFEQTALTLEGSRKLAHVTYLHIINICSVTNHTVWKIKLLLLLI